MTEEDAIAFADQPATVATLVSDLRDLGVEAGMTVMVHSSLSRLGYVAGGAQAVVAALVEVVGVGGTVMMPTHSGELSDPASWSNPPVPKQWWEKLRSEMPAFDPQLTPTRGMGAIVECFRHWPGVLRSAHPTVSAAAVGPNALTLTSGHELDMGLGESSPQARLYDLDGHVLLLGVSHANNTTLHLAEHRAAPPDPPLVEASSPVLIDGQRGWVSYDLLDDDDSDFERLGMDFDAAGLQRSGPVGAGTGHLMRAQDLVDYATSWMAQYRRPSAS